MNAETEFQSEYEEPNENYTTYNFNVSFSSEQKAHLEVIEKFQSKEEYVEELCFFVECFCHCNRVEEGSLLLTNAIKYEKLETLSQNLVSDLDYKRMKTIIIEKAISEDKVAKLLQQNPAD